MTEPHEIKTILDDLMLNYEALCYERDTVPGSGEAFVARLTKATEKLAEAIELTKASLVILEAGE